MPAVARARRFLAEAIIDCVLELFAFQFAFEFPLEFQFVLEFQFPFAFELDRFELPRFEFLLPFVFEFPRLELALEFVLLLVFVFCAEPTAARHISTHVHSARANFAFIKIPPIFG